MQRSTRLNRIILAFATAVTLVGGARHAWANAGTAVSYSGPPGSALGLGFDAIGNITKFSISVDFDNLGNFVFASDLLIAVVAPNGNGVEFGGAGETLGYPSAGIFPSNWDTENNGTFTHGPVDLSAYGLGGTGTYYVYAANGWAPSPGASWFGAISFQGINPFQDSDNDGVFNHVDNCPDDANADQADVDNDGFGDVCDVCQGFDDDLDTDGDGIADGCDLCDGSGTCGIVLGTDWDTEVGGVANGTLCASEVTITPVSGSPGSGNFSGTNYAAAPLAASGEYFGYGAATEWTATFDPPVTDLLVYTYFWRAAGSGGGPSPATYTFDQPFVVVSGLGGTYVSADQQTLVAASGAFHSGILKFAGPVYSLSLTTSATDPGAGQGVTFGVNVADVDADDDSVVDACDLCPGFDDAVDNDADGVPDACDAVVPVHIGFDEPIGLEDYPDSFTNQGVVFRRPYGAGEDDYALIPFGSFFLASRDGVSFTTSDRRPFDLHEAFMGPLEAGVESWRAIGTFAAGGTITQDIELSDENGHVLTFPGFAGLASVTFVALGPDQAAGWDYFDLTLRESGCAGDADGDGVCDSGDTCSGSDDLADADVDGIADGCDPCAGGTGTGDPNADEVVDLDDHAGMTTCLQGPAGSLATSCECFDFDSDGDNDLFDFAEFQMIFTAN